jgi:hypothetical protein
MSERDFDDLIDESRRATEEYRNKIFVGVHPDSHEEAINVAWELAQKEFGLEGPKGIQVLRHFGTVGGTDRRVLMIINAG